MKLGVVGAPRTPNSGQYSGVLWIKNMIILLLPSLLRFDVYSGGMHGDTPGLLYKILYIISCFILHRFIYPRLNRYTLFSIVRTTKVRSHCAVGGDRAGIEAVLLGSITKES